MMMMMIIIIISIHLYPGGRAGEWLNVIPCLALGLHLLDWEFC